MAVLDVVVNNADRKGGHVLETRATAACTASTTASPSTSTTSCGRSCGAGPASRSRPTCWTTYARLADQLAGGLGQQLCELITAVELTRHPRALRDRCSRRVPIRCPATIGRPFPWPRVLTWCRPWNGTCRVVENRTGISSDLQAWTTRHPGRAGPGPAAAPLRHRLGRAGRGAAARQRDGPDVRLRHHAVRRHPHGPRGDVRDLRPGQPALARRRVRRPLRRRTSPTSTTRCSSARPRPVSTGRDLADQRDPALPRRHDRAAGDPAAALRRCGGVDPAGRRR